MRLLLLLVGLGACDGVFGLHRPDAGVGGEAGVADAPGDTGAVADVGINSACPAGYAPTPGGAAYRIVGTPATWQDAFDDCENDLPSSIGIKYTHLIVLGTDVERGQAGALLSASAGWVGLTDRRSETTFQWITDEDTAGYPPASGGPWATSQPSNGTSEDCVEVRPNTADLDDIGCTTMLKYICECDEHALDPTHF